MTDLTTYVPDTSKYTDPADRLIALALLVKSGRPLQYKHKGQTTFRDDNEGVTCVTSSLTSCLMSGSDYRAKPEPRVVWIVVDKDGESCVACESQGLAIDAAKRWDANDSGDGPHSVVRFVESTDDQ